MQTPATLRVKMSVFEDSAWAMLHDSISELGKVRPEMHQIERAEHCLAILRAVAEGKLSVHIEIVDDRPAQE